MFPVERVRNNNMRFLPAVLICLLAASTSLPASAVPASAPLVSGDYHLRTAITEIYGSQYPVSGDLDLHITPDGLVSGFYHPAFVRSFVPIVGGLSGNRIWFDIAGGTFQTQTIARMRVTGTIASDGSIDGGAWNRTWPQQTAAQLRPTALGADSGNLIPGQYKFQAVAR